MEQYIPVPNGSNGGSQQQQQQQTQSQQQQQPLHLQLQPPPYFYQYMPNYAANPAQLADLNSPPTSWSQLAPAPAPNANNPAANQAIQFDPIALNYMMAAMAAASYSSPPPPPDSGGGGDGGGGGGGNNEAHYGQFVAPFAYGYPPNDYQHAAVTPNGGPAPPQMWTAHTPALLSQPPSGPLPTSSSLLAIPQVF